jgi:predicted metal-dependent phosphoesterase TrpH
VARAAAAGVTVLSVTDHDTVAASTPVAAACAARGIASVPGIEITAIVEGLDVHILGYFIAPGSPRLKALLVDQRRSRVDRVHEIVARLMRLGIALDAQAILQPALDDPGKTPGRPWVARALVREGHVATTAEAFERWLGHGAPAFVPRRGVPPAEVVQSIHEAGGIASLAHPGLLARDEWIAGFVGDGLDALEAYHSEHDLAATNRYLLMAGRLGVAVSGGSDYHGDQVHGVPSPGSVSLPRERYEELIGLHQRLKRQARS